MRLTLRVAGLVLLVGVLTLTGWLLMSTSFMIHDDEGYVLLSLKNFSAQGRLYDDIFTQYGPTPYLYYDALHRLSGLPIDNLLGRTMALLHWIGAALAAGLIAWRLSGRYWTALFTLMAVFGYLWQMTWEPAHPGGLIAVLTAAGLVGAVEALWRGRTKTAALLLGLAGAALIFTKINVGVLWCCSAGSFLLLVTGVPGKPGRGAWLAAAGLALLPFLLMRPLLGDRGVLLFAVMFALSGIAVCLTGRAETAPVFPARAWLAGGLALAGLGAVIIGATFAHGTTPAGLLHGVLLDPLRLPVNFHLGFAWQPAAWGVLGVTLILAALWRLRPALRPQLADGVAGLRLLALGCFVWQLETWLTVGGVGGLISYALPLTPLFLLPLSEPPPGDRRRLAGLLVALIGLGQVLHAYPVAGSQLGWGTFLLLPLYVSGLAEAVAHLARRLQRSWPEWAFPALALTAAGLQTGLLLDQGRQRWRTSDRLDLPGAEALRPPENVRYALRILTANVRLHADVLYSRPGMFGFNLWSGVPTPTRRNATHWFWLLNAEEQQAIIQRLAAEPRSAIISSRPLIDFLRRQMGMTITGPLNDYIRGHYRPLFTVTGYEFLVPLASRAAPFYVAQNFDRRPGATGIEPEMITLNVGGPALVAQIVLRDVRQPAQILARWEQGNCQVVLEPIDALGRPTGEPRAGRWPLRIDGLYRLRLYHHARLPVIRPEMQLVFLDATGQPQAEACYDDPATVSAPPAGG